MTDRELMQQALEALESGLYPQQKQLQAITALRERLAQPDNDFQERLARAIEAMPFGDTARSFATFVREFK